MNSDNLEYLRYSRSKSLISDYVRAKLKGVNMESATRTQFSKREQTGLDKISVLQGLLSDIVFTQEPCPALLSELNQANVILALLKAEVRGLLKSVEEAGHELRH